MTTDAPTTPIEILLVEDNAGDVRLLRETLRDARIRNVIRVATDGEMGLAYLRREDPYAGAARPDLVLLDLNLPRKGGCEVLAEIKNDPKLCVIPVVILTTSKAQEDIVKSYQLHANCYISKPVELEGFVKVVRAIEEFWFSVVRLPKE